MSSNLTASAKFEKPPVKTGGFFYAEKAAELGNPESQNNLGVSYRDGIYVVKDLDKARYWFEKAAKQGHTKSIANLNDLIK